MDLIRYQINLFFHEPIILFYHKSITLYRTYLAAQRNYRKLHDEYNSKGERSVEETAKMVGFKLPHDPK